MATKPSERHQCSATVYVGMTHYSCRKSGRFFENDKWWCTSHVPSKVKERDAANNARWRERLAHESAERKRQQALGDAKERIITTAIAWREGGNHQVLADAIDAYIALEDGQKGNPADGVAG